jgi:hypothetical protein
LLREEAISKTWKIFLVGISKDIDKFDKPVDKTEMVHVATNSKCLL